MVFRREGLELRHIIVEIAIGILVSVVMGVLATTRPQPTPCTVALLRAERTAVQFRVPLETFKDTLMKVCPEYRP